MEGLILLIITLIMTINSRRCLTCEGLLSFGEEVSPLGILSPGLEIRNSSDRSCGLRLPSPSPPLPSLSLTFLSLSLGLYWILILITEYFQILKIIWLFSPSIIFLSGFNKSFVYTLFLHDKVHCIISLIDHKFDRICFYTVFWSGSLPLICMFAWCDFSA